ncbi:hypothetical protein K5549_014428 [Capra hircus]|nr:hypothetical protein K5549_014428 [Capra hircus]
MLQLDPKVKPNPLQKANLCSRLFFWWLNPLFKIDHKRKLEANDLYSVLPEDHSQHLGEKLQVYWDQEVLRAQQDAQEPSLMKVIIKCYGKSYLVLGVLTFLESSLLSAVLGELPPSQGQVSVHGRIAYVSQQPWVFPGTVRSNILFGKKYEKDRYEKVIKACALEEDLWLLGAEAIIEIGDGGTPLSEGQKARISLARAVYQDADIYLLDDPLSAVDAGVSRHLFEQCVRQALKEKITILVTHQLQYLKDASQILMLKDIENIQVTLPLEDHLEGKVGFKTYKDYFTAGADWLVIIFLILVNIAAQVAYVLQDWWLAFWANVQSDLYSGALVKEDEAVVFVLNWYLGVYSGKVESSAL